VLSTRFKLVNLEAISSVLYEPPSRDFEISDSSSVYYQKEIKSFVGSLIIQLVWQIQISLGESGGYLPPLR